MKNTEILKAILSVYILGVQKICPIYMCGFLDQFKDFIEFIEIL